MREKKANTSEEMKKKYREIKGTHSYEILANEAYMKNFQYFSPHLDDDRNDFIKDDDEDESNDAIQSDFVKLMLNLAFLPPDRLKDLKDKSSGIYKKEPENFSLFKKNQGKNPAIN
jgi:hypothetical protein